MTRVYKTSLGQNRFIQLFYSEMAVIGFFVVVVALPIFFLTPWNIEIKLTVIFGIIMLISIMLLLPIDGVLIYKRLPSIFNFLTKKNTYTQSEISREESYLYRSTGSIVHTKDSILAVFQIYPIDIAILNEQDKESFKKNMGEFLHSITKHHIQIKVINRIAEIEDYESHIQTLYLGAREGNASPIVLKLLNEYVFNLTSKINQEKVPFKDYFLIIPITTVNRPKKEMLEKYKLELDRKVSTLVSILESSKIDVARLTGKELTKFYKEKLTSFD